MIGTSPRCGSFLISSIKSKPDISSISSRITAALHGYGLHVEARRNELIVTNPGDPEKGQVVITLDEGYVSWERLQTAYWGILEGVAAATADSAPVPFSKIIY